MFQYTIRRLLLLVPTLLGITVMVFFIMALAPGGLAGALLNNQGNQDPEGTKAIREYYTKKLGLDQPVIVQYLRWLNLVSPVGRRVNEDGSLGGWAVKRPDLGHSWLKGRDVTDLFAEAVPVTLLMNLVSVPVIYSVSVMIGIRAAQRRGGALDVASGTTFLGFWSIPNMWAGVMLIGLLANKNHFHVFPTSGLHDTFAEQMAFLPAFGPQGFERGWLLDMLWHLVLPVVCLSYAGFAFLSKLSRSAVLENLHADYARTARAKGVDPKGVLYRHVLGNSLLPLITVAAGVGSSRVDLQACKLEYSIVSPK